MLTNLGLAMIKAGQALASRPDILSSEYLEALQKLQDDVPTYSNEVAFATLKQELSLESFNDVFTSSVCALKLLC
jgi:predicted unusual protein kinase regulating ubiquinone biosynthesis (AarF/ABC1/UbiB family)